MVEPHVYAAVAALFYVGIDLAFALYYSGKYDDKEWKKVKSFGIFTKALKNVMKNNSESFRNTD